MSATPGRRLFTIATPSAFRSWLTADSKPATGSLLLICCVRARPTSFSPRRSARRARRRTFRRHGDGVRDIALQVDDADLAFAEAVKRGAVPAEQPHDLADEHGNIRRAAVHTYGDTIHSLISYKGYSGPFLPGFVSSNLPGDDAGILRIDHMVGNVELGQMNHWAEFYSRVFGFHRYISFDDKDISTEYSA